MNLTFQDIDVGYSSACIQSLTLDVEAPNLIALIGDNGVGKSTLFRTICGLTSLRSGRVLLNNKDISKVEIRFFSQNITFLPNSRTFYGNLTVRDLLCLAVSNPSVWNRPQRGISEYSLKLLEYFGIHNLLDKTLFTLSDGQYQLVALVFALSRKTGMLLLDEPLAFLDMKNRRMLLDLLKNLVQNENRLILFSSHDLQGLIHCNQIWHITDKKLNVVLNQDIEQYCRGLMV